MFIFYLSIMHFNLAMLLLVATYPQKRSTMLLSELIFPLAAPRLRVVTSRAPAACPPSVNLNLPIADSGNGSTHRQW